VTRKLYSSFWTWFCLTAVLLGLYYSPLLFCGREYYASDHTFYFEPFTRVIAEAYRQGHLPLWNPYCYAGMPQLANPSPGIFYVPNFLFVWLPYSQALALIMLIQQLAAFVGGFLLVESLGWGVAAAAFCGLLMALNGYMMSLSANYSLPGSACWAVIAMYALLAISRPGLKRAARCGFVVLCALAVHWTIMAGRPEVFVAMLALLGTTAGFLLLGWLKPFGGLPAPLAEVAGADADNNTGVVGDTGWRTRIAPFAWQIGAMVLGILLSAIIILPVYEWSKLSPRANGLALEHVFNWSSNWYDLLCMLCPQPLGDLQQPTSHFMKLVASRPSHYPFLPSALIGPVAVSFALLGLGDKTFKERFLVFGGFCISLVLAIGKYGPVSSIVLKAVPFLSVLRYPCKLLIVVIFFAAVAGSRGIFALGEDRVRNWQKRSLTAFWLVLLAVAATFTLASRFVAAHLTNFPKALPPALVHDLGISLLVTSCIGLVVCAAIIFKDSLKISAQHLALLMVLLLTASIFVPAMKYAPKTVATGYYAKKSGLHERLKEIEPRIHDPIASRFLPLYFDPLKVASGYVPRYPNQVGEPFMQYTRELCLPNTAIDQKLRVGFGYESSENQDYRQLFLKTLHISNVDKKDMSDCELARFCLITGTRFVSTQVVCPKGPVNLLNSNGFKLVHQDIPLNYRIYEVLVSKPRAFFSTNYRTIAKQDEVVKAVMAPVDDPAGAELAKNVLVELDVKTDISTDPLNFGDNADSRANAVLSGARAGATIPKFAKEAVANVPEDKMAEAGAKTAVSFLRDEPEHLSLSANVPESGFFVLNDRFYPGWHAVVDTRPVPMYRANGFMRAVYLEKGAHLIDFNYEPESLRNGFYLSLLATFILLVCALVWLRQSAWNFVQYLSTGKWPQEVSDHLG
jgi:hypothetical protein